MLRSRSFDLVSRRLDEEKEHEKTLPRLKGSYGADSPSLARDRAIITDPEDTKRRRTIRLVRDALSCSWGFTLQTYGIRNKKTSEVEVMSYVDYIELRGPAWVAGMRRGDIILSVNGDSVEYSTHMELVQRIKEVKREMRLVVLFENCCKKVELHERYIKLKKLLSLKLKEFKCLDEEERLINQGIPLSRIDGMRRSTSSSISTCSDWDAYSVITSPSVLNGIPSNVFVFRNGVDSDTSSESIMFDSSFSSDKSQPNANQARVVSSNPDLRPKNTNDENDTRGLVISSHSDVSQASETSEEGLKHLYNITRCANHLTEACKCNNFTPGQGVARNMETASKDDSMSNLVDDSGHQLRAIEAPNRKFIIGNGVRGGRTSSSTSSSSSSPGVHTKKGQFYMESDSEDSVVSADIERSGSTEISGSGNADFRMSSKGQNAISISVLEKEEDEVYDDNTDSFKENISQEQKDGENQYLHGSGVAEEVPPMVENSAPCSDTSMNHPDAKTNVNRLQLEASIDSTTMPINRTASAPNMNLDIPRTGDSKDHSTLSQFTKSAESVITDSASVCSGQTLEPESIPDDMTTRTINHIIPHASNDAGSKPPVESLAEDHKNSLTQDSSLSTQEAVEPEGPTHSKKRLVDGILVNDQSQSTRL